jgi:NAD(P)-dependent dehydrogenase (short-subunit alcohol dehydrogenase family)
MSVNKVAIITGAGTGIGAAIAEELARTGVIVVIVGRRPAPSKRLTRITNQGGTAIARPGDIRDYASLKTFVRR